MSTDYNKKRYLELLDQRSIGENSNDDELSRYSCMLTNQLDWEIRDQYLSLMEKFLNGNISMPEFFAELRIKTYAIIDAVVFFLNHRILLSFDKKASKFEEGWFSGKVNNLLPKGITPINSFENDVMSITPLNDSQIDNSNN
jgi:hypothetical protein